MVNSLKYYTYVHSTPNGEVFYIGKGSCERAFTHRNRSLAWHEKVDAAQGISVKIVARFATENESFEHERALIDRYKALGAPLVNIYDNDYRKPEWLRKHLSEKMTGYQHKQVTCPHCGFVGGETSTKRWHFDKCKGIRPLKARVTVEGKRVYLGNFSTKEEVAEAKRKYLNSGSIV